MPGPWRSEIASRLKRVSNREDTSKERFSVRSSTAFADSYLPSSYDHIQTDDMVSELLAMPAHQGRRGTMRSNSRLSNSPRSGESHEGSLRS